MTAGDPKANNHNLKMKLRDGRALGYAEFGDPAGKPVFFFHGGNDSRLEAALLAATARELEVRLIAPDRPGYGLSDCLPGRQIADWPVDVAQLADYLGIERFAVVGHSGGGPYVATVTYDLPHRLTKAAMVSSPAPAGSSNQGMHFMFRLVNFAMARSSWLHGRLTAQQNKRLLEAPDKFFAQWGKMSPADGRLFEDRPEVQQMIAAEMREALRQGNGHILQEHRLYKRPWGFDLDGITVLVHIWHGLADRQASPAWSRALAEEITDDETHFIPDEGHFSLLVNYQEQILRALLA